MSKTDIWMPVYIGDYLADTIGLSKSEHGSYLLAMMAYWRKGGPLTDKEIRSILGDDAETILEFFYQENELWNHKRINAEINAANIKKETAQKNGKNGGNPNFKKGKANPYYQPKNNPKDNLKHNPEDNQNDKQKINSSPSPSPLSSKSNSKREETCKQVSCEIAISPTHIPIKKFTELYKIKTGKDYSPNWAKDSKLSGGLIKSLEATHGGNEPAAQYIASQIDFYFSWQKPEWWDFGVFVSSFNRMQAAQTNLSRNDAKQEKDLDRYRRAMIAED